MPNCQYAEPERVTVLKEIAFAMLDFQYRPKLDCSDARGYAFIALGSNLGDSCSAIRRAIDLLESFSMFPLLKSSLWRSEPVDCPEGSAAFINAAVGIKPQVGESPESMLVKLQGLERDFGRGPKLVMNEPRILDLDLIAFLGETRDSELLKLPHPRAHTRRFVLEPLAEIAPNLILPGQVESVENLRTAIGSQGIVKRILESG